MNKEVIKAMNKKQTKMDAFKKWWSKNGYKIMRVILFPLWMYVCIKEKLVPWLNSRNQWDEKRADEIFAYYVPRFADWEEEEKAFYFFDNGYGWQPAIAKKHLKLKDRRFWKIHTGFWGGKMREYLINKFELEGFTKELGDCSDYTEITFRMKEIED